jgi:sugar transferase (PEP-CTERM/EpsH1 system associated)
MKILVVTARFPYPPHKGDQAIPYHRLKRMGKEHEITLLTFYQSKEDLKDIDRIAPYCKQVVTVRKSKFSSVLHMVWWGLFSKLPFQVSYYRSEVFKRKLEALLAGQSFDLVHVYMLRLAGYGIEIERPKVLELIDSMQLNFQRRADAEKWPLKWLFNIELKRVKRYETDMVESYDRSIVVSDKDREYMALPSVQTIPLGIDTEIFHPGEAVSDREATISFTGNMGYFPNRHAILWFLENCWWRIEAAVPGVRLVIAGKNPGPALQRFDDGESIRVLGYVESIADILREAKLAIAPMQTGSGMQFKILEAMACGTPVVTTGLGLGSIPAQDRESIMLADEPANFADVCIECLTDKKVAMGISRKGLELVQTCFNWDNNVNQLYQLYNELLR